MRNILYYYDNIGTYLLFVILIIVALHFTVWNTVWKFDILCCVVGKKACQEATVHTILTQPHSLIW